MKGVVLAGGTGSRLNPLTRVTNKHLLPVYDKPMVYYPIHALVNAGIHEILLVTGGKNAGEFLRLLGNGRDFGLKHLNYTYQEGEGGIAEALGLAEYFAGGEPVCVVLGDNIIENNVHDAVQSFLRQKEGAKILVKEVEDAQRFGVAEIRGKKVVGIEEKPKEPKSNFAVIGIYLYDKTVFEKIRRLKPSGRGELEITDVNNFYIEEGKLTYEILDGWWTDAGTFESLLHANNLVAKIGANKMVRTEKEVDLTPQPSLAKAPDQGGSRPLNSPSLRRPGEPVDDTSPTTIRPAQAPVPIDAPPTAPSGGGPASTPPH